MDHDEIHEALDLGDVREAVASAAEECVVACLEALRSVGESGGALRSIAGVASITAERVREHDPSDLPFALSLCSRVIESACDELERLSELPAGLAAAAAARRCANVCQQALAMLYDAS
jgi:hypothetical protein